MNPFVEQTQDKNLLYTSTLRSLFEQKGYDCDKIDQDEETIYVMKFELTQGEKSFQPKPKINFQ